MIGDRLARRAADLSPIIIVAYTVIQVKNQRRGNCASALGPQIAVPAPTNSSKSGPQNFCGFAAVMHRQKMFKTIRVFAIAAGETKRLYWELSPCWSSQCTRALIALLRSQLCPIKGTCCLRAKTPRISSRGASPPNFSNTARCRECKRDSRLAPRVRSNSHKLNVDRLFL